MEGDLLLPYCVDWVDHMSEGHGRCPGFIDFDSFCYRLAWLQFLYKFLFLSVSLTLLLLFFLVLHGRLMNGPTETRCMWHVACSPNHTFDTKLLFVFFSQ